MRINCSLYDWQLKPVKREGANCVLDAQCPFEELQRSFGVTLGAD